MSRISKLFRLSALAALSFALPVFAQFSASVQGSVQDPSGAAIPIAEISITNVDTKVSFQAKADASGNYRFVALPPGNYSAVGSAKGFSASETRFSLLTAENRNVDFHLKVGSEATTIQVSTQSPLLDTSDSRLQETVDSTVIEALPLSAHNALNALQLTPGVVGLGISTFGSLNTGAFWSNVPALSANGRGTNSNQYVLDGLDVNQATNLGSILIVPNADAVQEIAVQTNTYAVDYGDSSSIQTIVTSKPGTTKYHGFASEFYSYQGLNARGYFGPKAPNRIQPFHANNLSFGVGADVLHFTNLSRVRHDYRLYFMGHPAPQSENDKGSSLSITQAGKNAMQLNEVKDYGRHYPHGPLKIYQRIAASQPIDGWAVGTYDGDIEKFLGRGLGSGAFINDANLRKFVSEYSGHAFNYAFEIGISLEPGQVKGLTLATTLGTDAATVLSTNETVLAGTSAKIRAKDEDWKTFFRKTVPVFSSPDESMNRLWDYIWYVVHANDVKSGLSVTSDFTVPTKFGYWGCYIWDSAFHALGQSQLRNDEIAKNSVRAILSIQFPNGFLPVNAGADAIEVNTPDDGTFYVTQRELYHYSESPDAGLGNLEYRSPQPHQWGVGQVSGRLSVQEKTMLPLIGVAAWQVYLRDGDRKFLAEIYENLSRYDDWLWRRRTDGDGLLIYHIPEENGWDNATRMLPVPVKTVDGSTILLLLHRMLADSAAVLGKPEDQERFAERAEKTSSSITERMWDEQTGFFYDLDPDGRRRTQKSPAGFTPLMAQIVSPERAQRLLAHLNNAGEFSTKAPVPSVSRDAPEFEPSTWGWNGPSWIPSNWFVMESLARSGYLKESGQLFQSNVRMMTDASKFPSAYEQYNSTTGAPFGVTDYSWSASLSDYMVRWVAGIRTDVAAHAITVAPALPESWNWFEISQLRIGGNEFGYRFEKEASTTRLVIYDAGSNAFAKTILLKAAQQPKNVRVDGVPVISQQLNYADGTLSLKIGSGSHTVEFLQ